MREKRYAPTTPPSNPALLSQWLQREVQELASQPLWDLPITTEAPGVFREGMMRYADGTSWDPGSGKGPYYYDGSDWVPMFVVAP